MRIRTLAAAALVAAGLTVSLAGAAGAAEPGGPDPRPVILTCEDGRVETRPATDAELAELEAVPPRMVHRTEAVQAIAPTGRGGHVAVAPEAAERGTAVAVAPAAVALEGAFDDTECVEGAAGIVRITSSGGAAVRAVEARPTE
ncbi:hypothetical protein [Pseudonocardia nigra]|uniref:hypothetical protein n=1 Tax=Pseudonocardia nigra TaxID=1921578 RepID=UPI001C5DEB5F|nr:hypothetical protein [Pseudonocardia nigra]